MAEQDVARGGDSGNIPCPDHTTDAILLRRLREAGFEGPDYARFEQDLVGYAVGTVLRMVLEGTLFDRVAERTRWVVGAAPAEQELLRDDEAERVGLANDVVADALPRFRREALIGGGWNPKGGASLRTYFVGACLHSVPNAFRRWRAGHRGPPPEASVPLDESTALPPDPGRDPADRAADRQFADRELAQMDAHVRTALVRIALYGDSIRDVARNLDIPPRKLERDIDKARRQARRRREESA